MAAGRGEEGFSLLEIVVAMMILAVGVLGMAGSTAAIFTRLRVADRRNERSAAVQYSAEGLRAGDFDDLSTRCSGLSEVVGDFTVTCAVESSGANLLGLYLVSSGPGLGPDGRWKSGVVDTTLVQIAR